MSTLSGCSIANSTTLHILPRHRRIFRPRSTFVIVSGPRLFTLTLPESFAVNTLL